MELPSRKLNRLENYDYSQNGCYFITVCTKERKRILCDIVGDDAHIVPKKYGLTVEKYIQSAPEIEKYVIMPDHIHFIVRIDNGSMWASTPTKKVQNIVRSLKILVTKEIGEAIFNALITTTLFEIKTITMKSSNILKTTLKNGC